MSLDDTPLPQPVPDGRDPDDALLKRYREASALDPARPTPALREAVLAQARAAAASQAGAPGEAPDRGKISPESIAKNEYSVLENDQNSLKSAVSTPLGDRSAANDRSWRIRAIASVSVLGLATLLFLQFERGTPEEREMAMAPSPATVPAPGPTQRAAPTAQAPDQPPPAAPRLPAAAETPVPAQRSRDTQASATPINRKVAPDDKAGAEQGPSSIASTTNQGPLAAAAPTERAVAPAGAAGRDSMVAESASGPGTTGPGQSVSVMKAAPSPAPARAPEPSFAASPTPAAPAAALAGRPALENLEARSRAMSTAAAPAGRSADTASPALNGTTSTASQRLLAAAGSGALEAARQALKEGAPVNAPDAAGQTPLMTAARRGDEAMVRLLLAAGADRAQIDATGLTAADHARRAGQATLIPLLNAPESSRSIPSIPPAPQR